MTGKLTVIAPTPYIFGCVAGKGLRRGDFVCVAAKGVTGALLGCVAAKGLSREFLLSEGFAILANCDLAEALGHLWRGAIATITVQFTNRESKTQLYRRIESDSVPAASQGLADLRWGSSTTERFGGEGLIHAHIRCPSEIPKMEPMFYFIGALTNFLTIQNSRLTVPAVPLGN